MTWKIIPLSEVAHIERDGVDASAIPSGTEYVGLEDIESGGRILRSTAVKNGELASTKFRFGPQHILYGKLRPYLAKIALPEFSGICSTDILPIRPKPGTDRKFLAYYLRQPHMVEMATARAAGVNLPRISPRLLAEFEVPRPPLEEQRRIAAILDKADTIRRKGEQSLAFADDLLKSAFLEMFGDLERNERKWPTESLRDLLSVSPQNGLYKPSNQYGSGTRILRIDGFYDGYLEDERTFKRLAASDEEKEKYGLNDGDIVINRVNSRKYLGKSALVEGLSEPTVFESNMMRFAVATKQLAPRFLVDQLQTEYIKRQILTCSKDAVNQSSINQRDVESFRIRKPPIELQRDYVRFVEANQAACRRQLTALTEARQLFASLSQRAFRGEL